MAHGAPGLATIVKDGPSCTRTKDKRDAALELLTEHGLTERMADFAQALAPEGTS